MAQPNRVAGLTALVVVLVVACSNPGGEPPPAGDQGIAVTGAWLSAGEHGVWLSGDHVLYRLHPASGELQATIEIPEGPCEASAVGLGAVWTATCQGPGLARIDPGSNTVTAHLKLAIPALLDGEASIGVGGGSVWLVLDGPRCTGCRVAQIDPATMRVTAEIPVADGSAAPGPDQPPDQPGSRAIRAGRG